MIVASFNRLSSSTDSRNDLRDSTRSSASTPVSQLRDEFIQLVEQFIEFPDTTSDNIPQLGTPTESILKDNGSKDIAKFTQSMLQYSQNMTQL